MFFSAGGEKELLKTKEDVVKWFNEQIISLTDFSGLFSEYDTRGQMYKAQCKVMGRLVDCLIKDDKIMSAKDVIEYLDKQIDEYEEILLDGEIPQLNQLISAQKVFFEVFVKKIREMV